MKSVTLLKNTPSQVYNLYEFGKIETPFCKTCMNRFSWRVGMIPEGFFYFWCVISKNKKQMLIAAENCQICYSFVVNKLCENRTSLTHLWLIFPFNTSLKTPENFCFFIVFRGYIIGTLFGNGLTSFNFR